MIQGYFLIFVAMMGFAFLMLFVGLWHHDQIVAERKRNEAEIEDHRNRRRYEP